MSGEGRPAGGPPAGERRPEGAANGEWEQRDGSGRRAKPLPDGGAEPGSGDGTEFGDESASDRGPTLDTPVGTGAEPPSDSGADGDDAKRNEGAGSSEDGASFETGASSVGVALTVGASLIVVVPLAVAPTGLFVGVAGLVALGLGVRFERPLAFGVGVAGLAGGTLLAGLVGAPSSAVLAAAAGTLLAWDVADRALVIGHQLGRNAPTARLELVRATATGLLLAVGAVGAYVVFQLVGGGKPTLVLALLVLGATVLAASLR